MIACIHEEKKFESEELDFLRYQEWMHILGMNTLEHFIVSGMER